MTGWPPGLLQDDDRGLSRWLANRPGARRLVHTLGRINNDGNYEPENVVWETRSEQMNNTRGNRLVTHLGETMTVAQWAKRIGIPAQILYSRLHRKWPIDRAFGQEVRR